MIQNNQNGTKSISFVNLSNALQFFPITNQNPVDFLTYCQQIEPNDSPSFIITNQNRRNRFTENRAKIISSFVIRTKSQSPGQLKPFKCPQIDTALNSSRTPPKKTSILVRNLSKKKSKDRSCNESFNSTVFETPIRKISISYLNYEQLGDNMTTSPTENEVGRTKNVSNFELLDVLKQEQQKQRNKIREEKKIKSENLICSKLKHTTANLYELVDKIVNNFNQEQQLQEQLQQQQTMKHSLNEEAFSMYLNQASPQSQIKRSNHISNKNNAFTPNIKSNNEFINFSLMMDHSPLHLKNIRAGKKISYHSPRKSNRSNSLKCETFQEMASQSSSFINNFLPAVSFGRKYIKNLK